MSKKVKSEDPADSSVDAPIPSKSESPTSKVRAFVAALVALQLLIPLTYYLRDDPYDERFAWRMFSGVRLHRCQTEAFDLNGEQARPIRLPQVIHRAWINHLSRNRRSVVHAFLERRCEDGEGEAVRVVNRCVTPSRRELEPQIYERVCATGELEEPEAFIVPEAEEEAEEGARR